MATRVPGLVSSVCCSFWQEALAWEPTAPPVDPMAQAGLTAKQDILAKRLHEPQEAADRRGSRWDSDDGSDEETNASSGDERSPANTDDGSDEETDASCRSTCGWC